MKTKTIVFLLAAALVGSVATGGQSKSLVITVPPTGIDDTANLQSAFDEATAAGAGTTVQLMEGTYYTRQLVVNNFQGTFVGAGAEQTVLSNPPEEKLNVAENHWSAAPSAANPWPNLVSFADGDFLVSDLGIHITGAEPTTGWWVPCAGTDDPGLLAGFFVLGTEANAVFSRVRVEGEPAQPTQPTAFGYNLINGIVFSGLVPISGSFVVRDSTFLHLASGTPFSNTSDASILIRGNNFEDVLWGADICALLNSKCEFSFNAVQGVYGIDLLDCGAGTTTSKILVSNNTFSGPYGVYLEATFAGQTRCQVVANDFRQVTDTGVYLGPGTSHCVVAGNTQTSIVNLGTHNVIANGGRK
jgi:hypothetical protein